MQVAIVAPSSVPFTIGGAEKLCRALQHQINETIRHQAELIKLPSPEGSFWDLMRSYRAFSDLDLGHFDLVISTKYPAWMIEHENHVCYMLHRLRGLYDTYHFCGQPTAVSDVPEPLVEVYNHLKRYPGDRGGLNDFFELLFTCQDIPEVQHALIFPGPLSREIVHYLDGVGLNMQSIRKFTAISQNVATRKDYFPASADVEVLHPPTELVGMHGSRFDYLLTVSRLDSPKRIELIIQAMQFVNSDIPLKIVGTGPERENLVQLAGNDKRIEFIGFVNNDVLADLYANALAVVFTPYDEDMGFITLEAMLSEKPVITCKDSGGSLEFVEHGLTGLVASPEPESLARYINDLVKVPEHARRMGARARQRAEQVSWPPLVSSLLGERSPAPARSVLKKRMVVTAHFPVYPPRNGGQTRIFQLYSHLADHFDVTLLNLAPHGSEPFDGMIVPNVREIRIPVSGKHAEAEAAWSRKVDWVPVTDVVMPLLIDLTPEYRHVLSGFIGNADVIVLSHPYLFNALELGHVKELWYEAQDVEIKLKSQILPSNRAGHELLKVVQNMENSCWNSADRILVCSADDARELKELYGNPSGTIHVVPNGADFTTRDGTTNNDRSRLRFRLGLDGRFIAVFLASWHGPNLTAMERILEVAPHCDEVDFFVMGSVGAAFANRDLPANVILFGEVENDFKTVILCAADIALNPMEEGSGSNLKVLDYLAHGLPVVTTKFGIRGLEIPLEPVVIMEQNEFREAILHAKTRISSLRSAARNARSAVEAAHSWASISDRFIAEVSAESHQIIVDPIIRTTSIDRMPQQNKGAKRGTETI